MITASLVHQLADICRRASEIEILPRFRALEKGQIEAKSSFDDLVTVADQASERFIFDELRALYPEAVLVGEESVYANPKSLADYKDADLAFVLDPIDGTWHFANGSSAFGILLALAHKGEVQAGIIYEPVTGDYLWAIKGEGAFERTKGKDRRLQVGLHKDRDITDTVCSFPFGVFKGEMRTKAIAAAAHMGRIMDYKCSAAEYRLFATGALAFSIHRGELCLWDHAANLLIAKEAGGVALMLDGSEYHVDSQGILIIAESQARWNEVAALLK